MTINLNKVVAVGLIGRQIKYENSQYNMSIYKWMTRNSFLYEEMEDEIEKYTESCCAEFIEEFDLILFEQIFEWYFKKPNVDYYEYYNESLWDSKELDLVKNIVDDISINVCDYNEIKLTK